MSSLTIPTSVTPLPALNIPPHGHGHGHKKGFDLDSTTDTGSSTAAQIPAGSAQNMFGSLFASLAQLIGVQPATAAGKPATPNPTTANNLAATATAGTAAGSIAAAGAKINLMA